MAALANYAALKAAIQDDCAGRTDTSFVNALPLFTARAEQRIYQGGGAPMPSPPLRIRSMEVVDNAFPVTAGVATVPTPATGQFLGFKRVAWLGSPKSVPQYIQPDEFWLRADQSRTQPAPTLYTIEATTMTMTPAVTGNLSVTYYAPLTPLQNDSDTNWLLTNAPDIYLQGCLMYAYRWAKDDNRAQIAFGDFQTALTGLQEFDIGSRHSGNRLAPTLRRVV
jgi:hypothetical protein